MYYTVGTEESEVKFVKDMQAPIEKEKTEQATESQPPQPFKDRIEISQALESAHLHTTRSEQVLKSMNEGKKERRV